MWLSLLALEAFDAVLLIGGDFASQRQTGVEAQMGDGREGGVLDVRPKVELADNPAFIARVADPSDGGLSADSDDAGQRFRTKPDTDSDPRRTPIPMIPDRAVVDVAMGSGARLGVKRQRLGSPFSQRFSLQQQAMDVVDQSVQHGVGDRRVADDLVPMIDRQLAGDDGRAAVVTVVHDLQQIAALVAGERRQAPVVQDQQLHPADRLQQASMAAVAAGQGQRLQQSGHAVIDDRAVVPARLVA